MSPRTFAAAVTTFLAFAWLVGCAGARREARSTPVLTPVAAAPATAEPAPAEAPPAPAPAPTSTEARFAEAVAAFDAGRLDEAAKGFEAVLAQDGKHAPARYNLGVIAERQGDLAAAERAYQEALALRPDHLQSTLNLGKVLREQGRAAEAIPLYEAALQQPGRDGDPALLNALASAQRSAGQAAKAEATARRVLARSKDDAEAYRTLALCALDQGSPRLAELYALTARRRAGKDAAVANTLGLIYLRLGERLRALAELQRALALDPSYAPAHLNLGSLALANRDYATAEKAASRALALEPWSQPASMVRAWALDGLRAREPKRGMDAGAAFEKVLAFKPDDPEATCGAGFGYGADRAGYDRALPFLEKCLKVAGTPAERQAAESRLKAIQGVLSSAAAAEKPTGGSGTIGEKGQEGQEEK